MRLPTIKLEAPYLIFFGDVSDSVNAKTGLGIAYWSRKRCAGQMSFSGSNIDSGLPNLDVAAALGAGVRTVVIGVAPVGGRLQENWLPPLLELAGAGVDIASGLHSKLVDVDELVRAAAAGGARLIDVRVPPPNLPCGTGRRRSGKRLLTMGTDCAVGKKYTALALHGEFLKRRLNATFRATGQTGMMIAGEGLPIDAVGADFIAGAAEVLSPDNASDHWDVIEGQGSLIHPGYSGVTLGLLHGSQPDAVVVCHDASRESIHDADSNIAIPPLDRFIDTVLLAARVTNPACICVGISINTASLGEAARDRYLANIRSRCRLPVVDPVACGVEPIADYLLQQLG